MDKVIVIGDNHHNTLGLVRSLGREGIMSSLILFNNIKAENYILKSKYISDYTLVNTCSEMMRAIMSRKVKGEKTVIICTSDLSASYVDHCRDKLSDYFYLPGCERSGELTILMNKKNMLDLAVNSGLRVPKSKVVEIKKHDYNDITFPCIIKPISSITGKKTDIKICKNNDELENYFNVSKINEVQIQNYINKTMEYQLIGLIHGNNILIPGRSVIISQPLMTNTGYLRYEKLDGSEPIEQCIVFLKKTGYSGLFSMEFIRDSNGNDYFMEINFRNDGNSICVTEAGVNLPFLWYKLRREKNFSLKLSNPQIKEIYVIPEFDEINLWYSRNISFCRMIKELREADAYMEYAKDDPAPTRGKKDLWKKLILSIIKRPIRRFINLIKV